MLQQVSFKQRLAIILRKCGMFCSVVYGIFVVRFVLLLWDVRGMFCSMFSGTFCGTFCGMFAVCFPVCSWCVLLYVRGMFVVCCLSCTLAAASQQPQAIVTYVVVQQNLSLSACIMELPHSQAILL